MTGYREFRDGPILRTNRAFMELKRLGDVDDKDRAVASTTFTGKEIASPDRHLGLAMRLVAEVLRTACYSSREAMIADRKTFRQFVEKFVKIPDPAPPLAVKLDPDQILAGRKKATKKAKRRK